jgi:sugar/nucleoside kinase (ribokinase family)
MYGFTICILANTLSKRKCAIMKEPLSQPHVDKSSVQKSIDCISVCNALMDVLIPTEDADLKTLGLNKGVMHLVDSARQQFVHDYYAAKASTKSNTSTGINSEINSGINSEINSGITQTEELGGSSLNAIRTLASLGHKTHFSGMINNDVFGKRIEERLNDLGIHANLHKHTSEATGTCLILISPDGERTMNTNLGASRLYSKNLVPDSEIRAARIFHFSGYQWDTPEQKDAIKTAISIAKASNTLVSFDIADPFVVSRNRADFEKIIREDADIVFANREEAKLLFESTPESAASKIAQLGKTAVVKLGAEGALVAKDGFMEKVSPVKTNVVDTTGAGDMFAAGFLHGILIKSDLRECGFFGATLASDVISRFGATLSKDVLLRLGNLRQSY